MTLGANARAWLLRSSLIFSLFVGVTHTTNALADRNLEHAKALYETEYEMLGLAPITLRFQDNLNNFSATETLELQQQFYRKLGAFLAAAQPTTPLQQLEHALLGFEVDLNQQRLSHMEKTGSVTIPENTSRLSSVDGQGFWYEWLVQKWTGTALSPEEVQAMGESHLASLQKQIVITQEELARRPVLVTLIDDPEELQQVFESRAHTISQNLNRLFPASYAKPFNIQPGDNEALAQTPGYYNRATQTFHYNLFDTPYRVQDIDWLLLHEADPGHHFQFSVLEDLPTASFLDFIDFPGYAEGWAAYIENFGEPLGVYQTPLDRLGMLEWNRIRALRVVLDVGLNYQGWSKGKAMEYWRREIPDADDIGNREIARMLRWPGQVHTYVIGALLIEARWEQYRSELGDEATRRGFHQALLELGPIPPGKLAEIPLA